MRLFHLLAIGASLAVSSPLLAQNDQVLTGPEPDWVQPSEPIAVPANATGAIFVRKQDTLVHLDAAGQTNYVSQHIKLLNSQALELGNMGLTWNPAAGAPTVHAIRIHRDGTVIDVLANSKFEVLRREDQLEQAKLDGLLTAVLRVPDLRVGDELEWSYSTPAQDPTLGNESFGALTLGNTPPSGRFRLGLSWTQGQEPKVRLTPEFAAVALRTPSTLELRFDDPKIVNPPKDAPPRYAWQRIAEFSDFASWPAVSQRFNQLFTEASQLAPDSPLRAEVARISAAHAGKLAQSQAALELVQQQVRYIYVGLGGGNLVPATADETWSRRYGDCKAKTALLLAMLRELGVDAEAVLVNNSALDDGFNDRLPSPGLFDHVLVRARIDGKTYWLDGTLPAVARADVAPVLPYRWVLPLAAKGKPLEPIARKPASVPDEMQLYEIDARAGFDAPARIVQTTIQRGIDGLVQYVQLSSLSQDQLENAFRSRLTGESSWDAIDSVAYRYDPELHASILTISGTGPVDWDDDGDGARSLSLPGGGFYPPERRQRAGDQDQAAPFYDDGQYTCHVTTVRVPSDTSLEDWSFNSTIDLMLYGRVYYRAWDRLDGTIRMVRGGRTEEPEIAPARAQRDNGRLSGFDNSMAWAYFTPGKPIERSAVPPVVPASWDPVWISSSPPCLPPDLAK